MIMTPDVSCISLSKAKIQQHPNWQPYGFENIECKISDENESKNEYAKYRKWLILKEQEFVDNQQTEQQKQLKISETKKLEEKKAEEKKVEEKKDKPAAAKTEVKLPE
jgi:hypothetical protein